MHKKHKKLLQKFYKVYFVLTKKDISPIMEKQYMLLFNQIGKTDVVNLKNGKAIYVIVQLTTDSNKKKEDTYL